MTLRRSEGGLKIYCGVFLGWSRGWCGSDGVNERQAVECRRLTWYDSASVNAALCATSHKRLAVKLLQDLGMKLQ